ncbi:MAG: NINE protein [Anaerotardibacter sp.]
MSSLNDLKTLKELLDAGAISQEEYDTKKASILAEPVNPQPSAADYQYQQNFQQGAQQSYQQSGQPGYQQPGQQGYQHGYQQQIQQPAVVYEKNKIAAGLFGILLGSLGIHKFYLGYTTQGLIMLLVTLLTLGIGAFVMAVIGLIEGIIYITKSDEEFDQMYVKNQKKWF